MLLQTLSYKMYFYLAEIIASEESTLDTRGNNFLSKLTTIRDGPVKGTETKNRWKHKKSILLQKGRGKERLEDYSTSVAKS